MIVRGAAISAACAALLCASAPAAAEQAPDNGCELHVWPGAELKSVTQGVVLNHRVDEALDPAKGGAGRPETLASKGQAALLGAMDLTELLKLSKASVVVHPDPLPRTALNGHDERHAPSASPCYSELIVRQLVYAAAPFAGSSLKTLFVYRDFGDAPVARSTFSTWSDTELESYPPKSADGVAAAEAELAAAFQANMRQFAHYATRPRKTRK